MDIASCDPAAKAPSIHSNYSQDVKTPLQGSSDMKDQACAKLPDEIIEQILLLTDPNAFASLILLNRKWRVVSQQAHLYAHHLSRCPSYSAAHRTVPIPEDEQSLPRLRRLFAREIKRNLFEAYLRPRETVISLVSTSISSASAPGGEAFHFCLSPQGHYILAYSSSRIHIIDVTSPEVKIKRELKILRRPASVTITDDGSLLAVLSTDLQIDLYDLTGAHPKHTRAVALDHTPRTIALSPTGAVLAAAYDAGVEVSSLDANGAATDRRAVKCYGVDSLRFSRDGIQLLGTTVQSRNPSTVVLTAPYYDPGSQLPEESVSSLWTTSILFPNASRDCSHAVLLPGPLDEASWTFTYDRAFETFRAVRIDDLRNGTTYFTGPIADSTSLGKLLPSTLPAASECGNFVAAGFQGSIWLYGIPEDLDALPSATNSTNSIIESGSSTPRLGRRNSAPSLHSNRHETSHRRDRSSIRTPQWQLLCDKFRNTFVEGRKIAALEGVSSMSWVGGLSSDHGERLVAVAPGVGGQPASNEDDSMSPVDGGRILIVDFDLTISNGEKRFITIEVGQNSPEILEEEHRDLDTEVAIVRRRTVAQRRGNRNTIARPITTIIPPLPVTVPAGESVDPFGPPLTPKPNQTAVSPEVEAVSIDEDQEAFDAPYSHTSPRSGTTLRRAATAVAVNRRLHPRAVAGDHIEYRRADGREEHPHESDADNWQPPPPPYSKEEVPPLPEHIQRSILAENARDILLRASTYRRASLDFPGLDSPSLQRSRTISSMDSSRRDSREPRHSIQRAFSDSTNAHTSMVSAEEDLPRREAASPVSMITNEEEDIYNVSPPSTPPPALPKPTTVHQIPRRPVGPSPGTNTDTTKQGQEPVSPVPTPVQEALDRRLLDWESATESVAVVPPPEVVPEILHAEGSSPVLTRDRMEQDVPARPDEAHHLVDLPSPQPVLHNRQASIENRPSRVPERMPEPGPEPTPLSHRSETAPVRTLEEEFIPIWKRSDTAPAATGQSSSRVMMPSTDQLARLNSRKSRPPGNVLNDPSRRNSGSFAHLRLGVMSNSPQRRSMYSNPPRLSTDLNPYSTLSPELNPYSAPPRANADAYGFPSRPYGSPSRASPAHSSPYSASPHSRHSPYSPYSPSRHVTLQTYNHHNAASTPNVNRPALNRLDTIQSATSVEPSPYFAQKSINIKTRKSAAKNKKNAKNKGWRASMRRIDRIGDGLGNSSIVRIEKAMNGVYMPPRALLSTTGRACTRSTWTASIIETVLKDHEFNMSTSVPIRDGTQDLQDLQDHPPSHERGTLSLSSQTIHADDLLNDNRDVAPPLHVSTTYRYNSDPATLKSHAEVDPEDPPYDAHIYARHSAPNSTRFETILSTILKGPAISYASGLSAFHAMLVLLRPRRIAIRDGYHGCHGTIEIHHKLTGLEKLDLDCADELLQPGDVIHVETPLNPTGEARSLEFYAKKAHARGAFLTVDATFGPPPLQDPFLHGTDIVMHSGTKYIGGHSDLLCGVLAVNPAKGKVWVEELKEQRLYLGNVMGNMEGWLGVRSLRTLELRVTRQAGNAEKLVAWLDGVLREAGGEGVVKQVVEKIEHASLQVKDLEEGWLRRQMPHGYGPVFAITMRNMESARKLPSKLRLFHHATSLGGVESLIEWRSMTDPYVDKRLIRVSVGIEGWEDLRDDLMAAFRALLEEEGKK
ncbi:hypothetical protein B7494_g952 [Chlorociboria aeruginascens]|nr:hypothetical protein B7494_g952 [Chlorociboria aeruginascens]